MGRHTPSPRQKFRLQEQEKILRNAFDPQRRLTVLDLGTEFGHSGRLVRKLLPNAVIHGIDIHPETVQGCREDCKAGVVYDVLLEGDGVAYLEEQVGGFDLIVAAEVIEHLPKERGLELLSLLRRRTKALAIVTCPIGFQTQGPMYGNPHQVHLSGWNPCEFVVQGWDNVGQWPPLHLAIYTWRPVTR